MQDTYPKVTIKNRGAELIPLSIAGLKLMYDEENMSFCNRLVDNGNGKFSMQGRSLRYTLITLLGAERYRKVGGIFFIKTKDVLERLLTDPTLLGIGDLGLFLWLLAEVMPEKIPELLEKESFVRFRYNKEYKSKKTMELAWFLTGLTKCSVIQDINHNIENMQIIARHVYRLLMSNYFGKGVFGHQARTGTIGILRGHVGSFADQVYPIYALSQFSHVFGVQEARKTAISCAETICQHQGAKGQWWWHYNANNGEVFSYYPVYSVHQDAMAIMALVAVEKITGRDFSVDINLGLNWIYGDNELGINMVRHKDSIIYRSFYKTLTQQVIDNLSKPFFRHTESKGMQVKYECRPYHLGWILFAFADFL